MDINLQHHNLLGKQTLPKSGGFLYLVAILYIGYHGNSHHFEFVQPPPQKLPHTTVDISTNFHEVWWKESKFFLNPLFCFHGNCGKVCPTDSNFFGLSHSSRCGCCSCQVSSISVRRVTCYDHFCVFSIC